MTRWKYLLIVVVLFGQYGSTFLTHILPDSSEWIAWIGLICWLPMFLLAFSAFLRSRWKEVAIFGATWIVICLPIFGITEPLNWIERQGFRIHVSPIDEYLASNCELVEFVENGSKQTVGRCEGNWRRGLNFAVLYDTTGELALSKSQRTEEWKDAMRHFLDRNVLVDQDDRAVHLFDHFYIVAIALGEMQGG